MRRVLRDQRGFTLLELLIAVALSGLVLSAALQVWAAGVRAWSFQENEGVAQDNVRIAMAALTRELREAQEITSAGAGTSSDPLAICLERAGVSKTVRYYLGGAGSNSKWFYRQVVPWSGNPLAERIKAFQLEYYPEGDAAQDIRRVKITLTGDGGSSGKDVTLETVVTLRVNTGD